MSTLTILTGASRGMGRAMAEQLLARGGTLLCIARHGVPELQALASAHGTALEQWTFDLADARACAQALRQWLQERAGQTHEYATLINNAGVIAPLGPLAQAQDEDTALALRVGLEAPMLLCSAFLSTTADWSARRRILNISSGLGRHAMGALGSYCAAKAGMDHFTRCLALEQELQQRPVRVCSLAPGVIETGMQEQLRSGDPARFPDQEGFARLHQRGQLMPAAQAAQRVLAFLERPDFGSMPVADVREH